MVNPINLFIIALTAAFLLPLARKISVSSGLVLFFSAISLMTTIGGIGFVHLLNGTKTVIIYTAGFKPPYSINLRFGLEEAFFVLFVQVGGLLGGAYFLKRLRESVYAPMLFLMLIMGIDGLIMTRDLFNLFVFMEISSISAYALIASGKDLKCLSSGFKYMIAGGITSTLYLIGVIFIYRLTGTLNLDGVIAAKSLIVGKAGFLALFLLTGAVLIELEPFPANGWALDVYHSAETGIAAMIATALSGGMFFVLYKILPLFSVHSLAAIGGAGLFTFFFSNLIAIRQTNARRLLGYSSIGQIGLAGGAMAVITSLSGSGVGKDILWIVVGGLFVNHFLAKAGLFWLAGIVRKEKTVDWALLREKPILLFAFGSLILALAGLPPFPGFWAKWTFFRLLAANHMFLWISGILIGSILEVVYLFRWFGASVRGEVHENKSVSWFQGTIVVLFALSLYGSGFVMSQYIDGFRIIFMLVPALAFLFYIFRVFPAFLQGIAGLVLLGITGWYILPVLEGLYLVFGVLFIGGGILQMIGTFRTPGKQSGFYPPLLLMLISMTGLLAAKSSIEFFFLWELMALGSYFLVLRGKKAEKSALTYIIFSSSAAYLMLTGFTLAAGETGSVLLSDLSKLTTFAPVVFGFLALAFLIKSGALGLHIWLPGAYAESEDEASPFISSILSKAGIFGLFVLILIMGQQKIDSVSLTSIIGWIGVLTALFGTLMAVFQEDAKKLLAYSSMGQVGYILLALALSTHLGWVVSLYITVNHLLFKGVLFMAIAGVISRTGTRKMYQMGGLIKQMPLSFFTVLISIIALAGIPPLLGFGGKWMLYTSLIEKGWVLQAGVAFFASAMAFLYCYRLLHAVFLGQPKPIFRNIKEASPWTLVPQFVMVLVMLIFSSFPNLIIKPLMNVVSTTFPPTIHWNSYTVISSLGYWNGNSVMLVTMGIFILLLLWLLLRVRSVQRVKQFNIVYAGERPDRPETTHFAHNFYAHYQKALGFWVQPLATRFWNGVSEGFHTTAQALRYIYTGNAQTYALHILLYIIIFYFIMR